MTLSELVENRISQANSILERLSLINIDGVTTLKNKIKREINFFEKCLQSGKIKEGHLTCSNLTHLQAVAAQVIKHEHVCTSVMRTKILKCQGPTKKICIDLILHGGSVWMKVVARNRKALTVVSNGDCSFGQKSIICQAVEYLECSKQHFYHFKPPAVIFAFANGIEDSLAKDLSELGITVQDHMKTSTFDSFPALRQNSSPETVIRNTEATEEAKFSGEIGSRKLNLGVTTLIAYVSALTNGGSHYSFASDVLKQHAEWERARPVKPILDKLFQAVDNFKTILNVLGGTGERHRGEELLRRITVVEDHPTEKLKAGGKAFVRSALNKGISFEVFLHESRALTEGKQLPL